MQERKVIKFGNSSYVVTLPLEWVKLHNLDENGGINLIETKNSITIMPSLKRLEKKASLNINEKPLKIFNRELISYYLKNYKYIEITGLNIKDKLEEIKIFKEKLSSLEIVEIGNEKIVLKDLSNPKDLNVLELIFEIVKMEKMLFSQLYDEKSFANTYLLNNLDSNINKLSFLALKSINYNFEEFVNFLLIKDSIQYWRIILALETIGDICKRISRYLKGSLEDFHHYHLVIEEIEKYFDFITSLMYPDVSLDTNLKIYLDKKQSLLLEFENLREKVNNNLNLHLVLTQLFKDILGQLDNILISVIDLRN